MPAETDIRLKSWLNANQLHREQMCRAILAVDPRYSEVRPRHSKGGPDGGRDIEAVLNGKSVTFGAVGFLNDANDSDEQKKQVRAKFTSDLVLALEAKPDLKAFVFLTNIHLTMGEQSDMKKEARGAGVVHCDVLDRERLRIELDSARGFFIRFQFLALPLSEAEQASFLAQYGEEIQSVIATGFQRIERTLNRILFLQESSEVLEGVYVRFRLKKSYPANEIGHFRVFAHLHLRALTHNIVRVWFGATDKSERFRDDIVEEQRRPERVGIAHGIAGGQWEHHIKEADDEEVTSEFVCTGWSSGIGLDPVFSIIAHYSHDSGIFRVRPRLQLRDLNEAMFMPVVNASLAAHLHSISVYANGYKLAELGAADFCIDSSVYKPKEEADLFSSEEMADPWVRIRPANGSSTFHLSFSSVTSRRLFGYEEASDTPSSFEESE